MYLAHWGLRQPPFTGAVDPSCFYQSPTHEEALARLQFLIDTGRRSGLLLGSAGTFNLAHLDKMAHNAQLAVDGFDRVGVDLFQTLAGCSNQRQIGQLNHVARNPPRQLG